MQLCRHSILYYIHSKNSKQNNKLVLVKYLLCILKYNKSFLFDFIITDVHCIYDNIIYKIEI